MEGRYVVVCFEKNIISISFNIHLESNIYKKCERRHEYESKGIEEVLIIDKKAEITIKTFPVLNELINIFRLWNISISKEEFYKQVLEYSKKTIFQIVNGMIVFVLIINFLFFPSIIYMYIRTWIIFSIKNII